MRKGNLFLVLPIIISLFVVCGCLKNTSNISSVIENVEGVCTYIYPIYEKGSSKPSRYCLTRCEHCPSKNDIDDFIQEDKDPIDYDLCPIQEDNTKYFDGDDILDQFNRYLSTNDKLRIETLEPNQTLAARIKLISGSEPKTSKNIVDKCLRVFPTQEEGSSKNKGILFVEQTYKKVKCNEKTLGFTDGKSKSLYMIEEKTISSFEEADKYAKEQGAKLPDESLCTKEMIEATISFLENEKPSISLTEFWLSNKKHCNYTVKNIEEKRDVNEAYITKPSQAPNISLENIMTVIEEYNTKNLCSSSLTLTPITQRDFF